MTSSVHTKQPYGFKDMIGHFMAVYLISAAVVAALNALCWYFLGTYPLVTVIMFPLFFAGLFWGFRTEKKLGKNPSWTMRWTFSLFTYPISAFATALLVWYCVAFDPSALDVLRGILFANTFESWGIILGFTLFIHLAILRISFGYASVDYADPEWLREQSHKWGLDNMGKRGFWLSFAFFCSQSPRLSISKYKNCNSGGRLWYFVTA